MSKEKQTCGNCEYWFSVDGEKGKCEGDEDGMVAHKTDICTLWEKKESSHPTTEPEGE